jgi:hypothetical protein
MLFNYFPICDRFNVATFAFFLLFQILCLQIGGSWTRSPTRVQALFQMEICFQDAMIVLIVIQLHTTCHWSSFTLHQCL